jgi:hypothetical protein
MRGFIAVVVVVAPMLSSANDFPTLDRVDQVLTCMAKHGGQTLNNLYACSCRIDAIAEQLGYEEFDEASTFRSYRAMPGEKGGVFRDSKEGQKLIERLDAVERQAEERCFSAEVRALGKRP